MLAAGVAVVLGQDDAVAAHLVDRADVLVEVPGEPPLQVPTGFAAFPDPVFSPPPRSFAEKTYNIVHWTDMPRGGHFASLEEPELFLTDLRKFASTLPSR